MNASMLRGRRPEIAAAVVVSAATLAWTCWEPKNDALDPNVSSLALSSLANSYPFRDTVTITRCDNSDIPLQNKTLSKEVPAALAPSWLRRTILAPIGISLPKPRLLTPGDPALKLAPKSIRQRQRGEFKMRQILEKAPSMRNDPEQMKALSQQLFEVTYGKGVTAQEREDFLVRYGCTGWNDKVLDTILEVSSARGIVEMGAGHGQWARALSEAYVEQQQESSSSPPAGKRKKHFDFVLAYDDNSDLPLNTHIYNPYTQPHHDYFGNVRKLETKNDMLKVLRSWACRGRVLLLVYPPPGDMATQIVTSYVEASPEDNDTVIFVGEGRGGANGNNSLFDYFERGDWELLEEMDVQRPPGDKGYEKLYILRRRSKELL
jgi:hypothetical protein